MHSNVPLPDLDPPLAADTQSLAWTSCTNRAAMPPHSAPNSPLAAATHSVFGVAELHQPSGPVALGRRLHRAHLSGGCFCGAGGAATQVMEVWTYQQSRASPVGAATAETNPTAWAVALTVQTEQSRHRGTRKQLKQLNKWNSLGCCGQLKPSGPMCPCSVTSKPQKTGRMDVRTTQTNRSRSPTMSRQSKTNENSI
eukprot:365545-Chlamydomonas_euryale.AAC.7